VARMPTAVDLEVRLTGLDAEALRDLAARVVALEKLARALAAALLYGVSWSDRDAELQVKASAELDILDAVDDLDTLAAGRKP